MGFETTYLGLLKKIPGVAGPVTKLTFKDKLKWTGLMLVIYFIMTQIRVFGVSEAGFQQFRFFEILLGSSFGSLMTLGIGPIVTASIILQLMVGSKVIPWDLKTEAGKMMFQGTQKLLAVILSFVEATVFVLMGGVPANSPDLIPFVIIQLSIGGVIVIFMDELVSKWGFGSGVGLFIVGGVAKTIIIGMFNPLTAAGTLPGLDNPPVGRIPLAAIYLTAAQPLLALDSLLPVIATFLVFFLVVYAQNIKVEVPLAFGSIRGFGRRWPLKFFYTSNIPVILTGALLANVQLIARMAAPSLLGIFDSDGNTVGGLVYFFTPPSGRNVLLAAIPSIMIFAGLLALVGAVLAYYIKKSGIKLTMGFTIIGLVLGILFIAGTNPTALAAVGLTDIVRVLTYAAFLVGGSTIFAIFWVATSGMDSRAVADQIESTGMQIPGFRRDVRIIERVLDRYIPYLTVLGGMAVGALAAFADLTNALGTGTGILLATMIIYQLYEELAMQHMQDMHPALRKLIE